MYDMKYMHDKYSIHNIHNMHCIYVVYALGQFLLCVRYILNGLCIIWKIRITYIICILCITLKLYIAYNIGLYNIFI